MACVAISLCINYSDYLAQALPTNRGLFSHYYVITEQSDINTIEIATKHNCTIIFTESRLTNGAKFNKSGMIQEAQQFVHKQHPDSWISLIDADIGLPANLWSCANLQTLNKSALYGITRIRYDTKTDYENNKANTKSQHNSSIPIGYFQLYYDKSKYYATWSKNCSTCDMDFMRDFRSLHMIRNIKCEHYGPTKTNWDGRVSGVWQS